MREPLSLNVMRAYFDFFIKLENKLQLQTMEEQFTSRYCSVQMNDGDHFAFAALSSILSKKLAKMKAYENKNYLLDL